MPTLTSESASMDKVIHDLRGPLINTIGFQSELQDSFQRLREMIDAQCDNLPDHGKDKFHTIFEQDIDHCMKHMSKSLEKLEKRVDELGQHFK